jgi:hypothetical protein
MHKPFARGHANSHDPGTVAGIKSMSPFFWPREQRRVPTVFVARIASPAVVHQLFYELHSIGWQEAPRLPSCDSPSSY